MNVLTISLLFHISKNRGLAKLVLTQNDAEPLDSIHTIILEKHPDADVRVSPTYSPHVQQKYKISEF